MTEAQYIIGMVQYHSYIWLRLSHILPPMKESYSGPKGRKAIFNEAIKESFNELKCMVSENTLLSDLGLTTAFTVHTYASDKHLGAVISQNNKPIEFFSKRLSNTPLNYTTTKKLLITISECLKQIRGIIFGYEINVFSYHNIWYMPQP